MAFKTLKVLHFQLRYSPFPISSRFLSLNANTNSSLSERSILHQLSDLLPPKGPNPNPTPNPIKIPERPPRQHSITRIRDRILSSDEKLRGVFTLNLKGRSAVESALTAAGVDLTVEIFHDVVNKGNLNGNSIVTFFDWAIKHTKLEKCVENYNAVIRVLGRRKFFDTMEEFLLRMKKDGVNPNLETIEFVIDSFVRARRVLKAVEFFKSCDLECFNALLGSLCRRSHVKFANSLFNSMRGNLVFDITSYNEIIGGWGRFGHVDKVESFLEMMKADGLSPDNVTLSYYIEALGRGGRIGDAVDVFDRMEEMGCHPNTMNYNTMISNYIHVGDLDEAMKYYKGISEKNCIPDVETYEKLIYAFLKVRRVADALDMFDEMHGRGVLPSTGMISSILEPLCNFGPPHAAMMIYNKSRKVGCKLSLKAYKLLLTRLSRFGKSGMMLKIWEEMQESGYDSDKEVYEYIVNGLCNIGHVDNAVLVAEEALRKGFSLGKVVYSKLNSKLAEMNRAETAYKLFLKVKGVRNVENSKRFWRANGWHF